MPQPQPDSPRRHGYSLRYPATRWQDAIPVGNGRVGALVYGDIASELIVLNHDELYLKTDVPEVPDLSAHLPELRRLLADGLWRDAGLFLDSHASEAGYQAPIDPYHPAGDLAIHTHTAGISRNYRRSLDFDSGECIVSWDEDETRYERRTFVSRADDVIVLRIRRFGGPLDMQLSLQPHGLHGAIGFGSGKDVRPLEPPISYSATANGSELTLAGKYDDGAEHFVVARIATGDWKVSATERGVRLHGAQDVTVVIGLTGRCASDDALALLRARVAGIEPDYDRLLARHRPMHSMLIGRCELNIAPPIAGSQTVEEIMLAAADGDVPAALIQTLFEYGRYLLVSSSAPGGKPANLQGVWNGDWAPAWSSDFHNDENIQMNYWAALPLGLHETTHPYFDYYDASVSDYRENALMVYGCRGILAPIAQTTHGKIQLSWWINWTAGAGWLAQLYFDYWLYTGDRDFLRTRAIPFLREVALFLEDFLVPDSQGHVHFSPSLSPENQPGTAGASLVTLDATMDVAIAREVLTNMCAACRLLDIHHGDVSRWQALCDKLPGYEINEDGALREWLDPRLADNYEHRHQSHIYPLFPGIEIVQENSPDLYEAVRVAIEKRLVIGLTSQTGWSFGHMANVFARLGDGDRALECLELLCRACLGPNLFTYHNDWRAQGLSMYWGPGSQPPFQIDANFGITAAVVEMLVFSGGEFVKLLPALPTKWTKGKVKGIRTRQGLQVSMEWDRAADSFSARLDATRDADVIVRIPEWAGHVRTYLETGTAHASDFGANYRRLVIPAGSKATLTGLGAA